MERDREVEVGNRMVPWRTHMGAMKMKKMKKMKSRMGPHVLPAGRHCLRCHRARCSCRCSHRAEMDMWQWFYFRSGPTRGWGRLFYRLGLEGGVT